MDTYLIIQEDRLTVLNNKKRLSGYVFLIEFESKRREYDPSEGGMQSRVVLPCHIEDDAL